jgi:hypothetical protein
MTSPPGGDPPLDPASTSRASNWAAGERRSAPRWLGWLVALPSAVILLLPTALAISSGASAYEVGRVSARAILALFFGLIARAMYVRARGRPWRSAISPWLLPVAVAVFFALAMILGLPGVAERQERIQSLETPMAADYLRIAGPYELTQLSPEEEAALEADMASTLREAKATEVETRYVELDGEPVGVVMVMAVEPAVVAEPGYLEDVHRGFEKAGADPTFGDLQGQRVVWARLPDEGVVVMWQHEALVISAFAVDRASAEEIASQLMAAN